MEEVSLGLLQMGEVSRGTQKKKGRTIHIEGAFLKAKDLEDMELMVKTTGELATIMCKIDPSLKFKDQGALYLKFIKALYGHIEAARLFYDDLDNIIQMKMNFSQNRYDPCIYNKKFEDVSVTIRVHIDDLKVSLKSKKHLENVVQDLKSVYGEISEHDYLGMVLSYHPEEKKITLNMRKYVEGILDEFEKENPEEFFKIVKTGRPLRRK